MPVLDNSDSDPAVRSDDLTKHTNGRSVSLYELVNGKQLHSNWGNF